ncbi:MAG: hypothetical protein JRD47_02385 [Deltaproteobacteria bacterium]|nr:hypothetical protein [Deltaproteobacteria bacterium]MBW2317813.1 hypothetical protein [Deltaproteobacteria bacterium]MBW2600769.1 hypothetical protein [Deltaproteobacteria bacterium]
MKSGLNPICKRGERNLYCTNYSDCLDHAVFDKWRYWSCGECSYKFIQETRDMVQTVNDSNIFYELPSVLSSDVLGALG